MKDCQGQLLQRVRRGLATAQDQAAFEGHLSSCESCRMTVDLMDDFDAVGEAEPGDYERVAVLATHAARVRGRHVPGLFRGSRLPWRFVVAALVVTGAATAGVVVRLAQEEPAAPAAQVSPAPGEKPSTSVGRRVDAPSDASLPIADGAESSTPETLEEASPSVKKAEQGPAASSAPSASSVLSPQSAEALYRMANDARRAGRSSEAMVSYQKLQRDFPDAPEAHASRVSLAGLFLRGGSASAALTQFDAYLGKGGGQLSAEALFGRAQALRALGRSAEEVQNLSRLVSTYPKSAYATHAKRRLLELR